MMVKTRFALKINLTFVAVCASSVLETRLCWNVLEVWARVGGTANALHLQLVPWGQPWGTLERLVPGLCPHHNPSHLTQRRVGHATTGVHFDHSRITTPVQQVTRALCFMSNKQEGKDLRQNLTLAGQFPFLNEVLIL